MSSKELKKLPGKSLSSGKKTSILKSTEKSLTPEADNLKKLKAKKSSSTSKTNASDPDKVKASSIAKNTNATKSTIAKGTITKNPIAKSPIEKSTIEKSTIAKSESAKSTPSKKASGENSFGTTDKIEVVETKSNTSLVEKSPLEISRPKALDKNHLEKSTEVQNMLSPSSNISDSNKVSGSNSAATAVNENRNIENTMPHSQSSNAQGKSLARSPFGAQNQQQNQPIEKLTSPSLNSEVPVGQLSKSFQPKNQSNNHPNHRPNDQYSSERSGRIQDQSPRNPSASDRSASQFSNSSRPGGKVDNHSYNGISRGPNVSQQEAILEIKISGSLFRKLKELSRTEGLSMDELATELVAEGCVVRAWELVERKATMKNLGGNTNHSGAPSHNNRGGGGFNNKQNYNPKSKEGRNNYNKIMEDNAHFLEYVRNQEKRQR